MQLCLLIVATWWVFAMPIAALLVLIVSKIAIRSFSCTCITLVSSLVLRIDDKLVGWYLFVISLTSRFLGHNRRKTPFVFRAVQDFLG